MEQTVHYLKTTLAEAVHFRIVRLQIVFWVVLWITGLQLQVICVTNFDLKFDLKIYQSCTGTNPVRWAFELKISCTLFSSTYGALHPEISWPKDIYGQTVHHTFPGVSWRTMIRGPFSALNGNTRYFASAFCESCSFLLSVCTYQ